MASGDDPPAIRDPATDEQPPGMPAWGKYLLLGSVAAVVLTVLAVLLVGGDHGPGRHGGSHAVPAIPAAAADTL